MTGTEEEMTEINSTRQLLALSDLLGNYWMSLGLKLGLSTACLENVEQEHGRRQNEQGYAMLIEWTRRCEATRSDLCQAVLSLEISGRITEGLSQTLTG